MNQSNAIFSIQFGISSEPGALSFNTYYNDVVISFFMINELNLISSKYEKRLISEILAFNEEGKN
jgi:hypothetical protein